MQQIIESAIGWDEVFQRDNFLDHLQPQWFYWILLNNERAGLACYRHKPTSLHIHLLIVFESAQRKGVASLTIQELLHQAHSVKKPLTLSCFKNNLPAINLYGKLDFEAISQDEHFYSFRKNTS